MRWLGVEATPAGFPEFRVSRVAFACWVPVIASLRCCSGHHLNQAEAGALSRAHEAPASRDRRELQVICQAERGEGDGHRLLASRIRTGDEEANQTVAFEMGDGRGFVRHSSARARTRQTCWTRPGV